MIRGAGLDILSHPRPNPSIPHTSLDFHILHTAPVPWQEQIQCINYQRNVYMATQRHNEIPLLSRTANFYRHVRSSRYRNPCYRRTLRFIRFPADLDITLARHFDCVQIHFRRWPPRSMP